MIKNLEVIETSLGLKPGDFKAMMDSADEKEIDLSGIEIAKKDELTAKMENIKKSSAEAATEVMIKKAREKFALEFTGKNIDSFAEALQKKTLEDAKIEPNEKLKTLTNDFNAMKKNFEGATSELETMKKTTKQKEDTFKIESTIMSKLPKETIIAAPELTLIFKSKFNPQLSDDGKILFHDSNGQVMKNSKTLDPMTVDEVMTDFQTPYVKPATGGAGGADNPGQSKPGGMDAFNKEMEGKGVFVGSAKYNEEMMSRIKDKTLTQ